MCVTSQQCLLSFFVTRKSLPRPHGAFYGPYRSTACAIFVFDLILKTFRSRSKFDVWVKWYCKRLRLKNFADDPQQRDVLKELKCLFNLALMFGLERTRENLFGYDDDNEGCNDDHRNDILERQSLFMLVVVGMMMGMREICQISWL